MRSTGNHWRQKYFNWRLETPRLNALIIINLYGLFNYYKPEKAIDKLYFGFKQYRHTKTYASYLEAKIKKNEDFEEHRQKKYL